MTPLRALRVEERSIEDALALGPTLLSCAQRDGASWIAASVVRGPAVVLGAAQRAGRVVDLDRCARAGVRVFRRATTGTAAYAGGRTLLWTLALPHVAALVPDATARTLLNRNVRGFLRGLKSEGLAAQYFGREWIAVRHVPAALLGFDVALGDDGDGGGGGAVLLEVIAGHEESIALPGDLATPAESEIDRWRGKEPRPLAALLPAHRTPEAVAQAVIEAVALHAGAPLEEGFVDHDSASGRHDPVRATPVNSPLDPVPAGLALGPLHRVPIGWIEAASAPASGGAERSAWLGGDVLAPLWTLDAMARAAAAGEAALPDRKDTALEGATADDLREALRQALGG